MKYIIKTTDNRYLKTLRMRDGAKFTSSREQALVIKKSVANYITTLLVDEHLIIEQQ